MALTESLGVVAGSVLAVVIISAVYFRRFAVTRPPIGVFNRSDITALLVGIAVAPVVYLTLPTAVATPLFGLMVLSMIIFTLQPVVTNAVIRWVLAGGLLAGDAVFALAEGTRSSGFLVCNAVVIALAVVGMSNLWAQSGMRVRHLVVIAAVLTVYDVITTSWLPVTSELLIRFGSTPFAPSVSWVSGAGGLGIGLGDLLLAATFPLVVRKAYGRRAGLVALVSSFVSVTAVLALVSIGGWTTVFPVMALLGPVIVVECAYLMRTRASERTTWQYAMAEPRA